MLALLANGIPANNLAGGVLTVVVPLAFLAVVVVSGWLISRRRRAP